MAQLHWSTEPLSETGEEFALQGTSKAVKWNKLTMNSISKIRLIFDDLFDLWLGFILAALGILTNSQCVAVLHRQGLQESAVISLAAVSLVDLLKCIVAFLHRFYGLLRPLDVVLAENWYRTSYLVNTYCLTITGSLVNVFTMYVTVERCLCVCLPFQVKQLITSRVTYVILAGCTLVVVSSLLPPSMGYQITWSFDLVFNQSMAQFTPTSFLQRTLYDYTSFINIFLPGSTFVVIMVATSIIIIRLRQFSRFRSLHSSTSCRTNPTKPDHDHSLTSHKTTSHAVKKLPKGQSSSQKRPIISQKDAQLVKMLLLLVLMYLVNVVPRLAISSCRFFVPEFYVRRQYHDLYLMVIDCMTTVEFINSSTTLFVYLSMSSLFRNTYLHMFSLPA